MSQCGVDLRVHSTETQVQDRQLHPHLLTCVHLRACVRYTSSEPIVLQCTDVCQFVATLIYGVCVCVCSICVV